METITELERMAAAHWRGTEEEWLGGWLLRAAGGFTGRANSALPLGDPGLPVDAALAAVTRWYRARGLPPMIAVPVPLAGDPPEPQLDNHLSERSWLTRPGPAFVMLADLPLGSPLAGPLDGLPAGWEVRLSPEPDDAWAARYHYRGQDHLPPVARQVLTSAPEQSFVSIRTRDRGAGHGGGDGGGGDGGGGDSGNGGEVLAIARLSIAGGWAGLTAVEVHPDYRRRGLGAAITAAACREAERHAIPHVFLQVEEGNAAAQALYRRLGFRYSHRYHYRVAPE